jgi:glutaredoxin
MTMGVIVYYAEISGSKEVKKRQQRVMMILESKTIPYEAIDITEPGKENEKDFMMKNGKIRGDIKYVQSPQIFNGEVYCGDYEDFDLANENDVLEEFLNTPKIDRSSPAKNGKVENGSGSREGSSEPKPDVVVTAATEPEPVAEVDQSSDAPAPESAAPPPTPTDMGGAGDTEISSTTADLQPEPEPEVKVNEEKEQEANDNAKNEDGVAEGEEEPEEEEEKSQIDK